MINTKDRYPGPCILILGVATIYAMEEYMTALHSVSLLVQSV